MGANYTSQAALLEKQREKEVQEQKKIQTVNPELINEHLSSMERIQDNQMGNTNDEKHQYKNILKTLYKNNLTTLTYEDMNAYFIQMNWKHYVISKNCKKKRGIIDVIYTSVGTESNSVQRRFFDILENKEYPYRCYNLIKYKYLRNVISEYGGYENLPAVFINDFYIGSAKDFEMLEENGYVNQLLSKGILDNN